MPKLFTQGEFTKQRLANAKEKKCKKSTTGKKGYEGNIIFRRWMSNLLRYG